MNMNTSWKRDEQADHIADKLLQRTSTMRDIAWALVFMVILATGYTLVDSVAQAGSWQAFTDHQPGETTGEWVRRMIDEAADDGCE